MSDEKLEGPTAGRMELRHEAVPGYRLVFYVVLSVGVAYLAVVYFLAGGGH